MAVSTIKQSTAITPVLLWTNSDPYASFAAQTITLDITPYRMVMIDFIASGSAGKWKVMIRQYAAGGDNIVTMSLATSYYRVFAVSGTSIAFGDCNTFNAYNNWAETVSNQVLIPYRIYGIK